MTKRTIFKVIAITNFIVLFVVFLMFRNGSFNNYFYKNNDKNFTSSNGGVAPKYNADSIRVTMSLFREEQKIEKVRLSSSKSLVATDNVYWSRPRNFAKDSMLVYPSDKQKKMLQRSTPEMMYSSKSGLIVDPKLFMFSLDSLLKAKEKQKKQP